MSIISVKKLVKRFGAVKAVSGIDFSVAQGEIVALLGPNGAGKTTTLEILEGIQRRTSGNIRVLGFDPDKNTREIKKNIGVQLQSTAYYEYLNLRELLDLFASFYGKRVDALAMLKRVGLEGKARSLIKKLSGGQQQRFSILATLINDPKIVFLDEPTTGLDPQARRNIWEIIRSIKKQGKTIILTTHYMEEAEVLADRILIIDNGKIIARGTAKQLISKLPSPFRIIIKANKCLGKGVMEKQKDVIEIEHNTKGKVHTCVLKVKQVQSVLPSLLEKLKRARIKFRDLEVIPSNLEDVFINLTGKKLRD